MENILQKQTVAVAQMVVDREEECAVNGDYVLPEYCPDIAVVLKCLITPRILSRQWSGDRLLVDGVAVVRVLYLDEERRCLREVEFTQPLSRPVDAKGVSEGAFARLDFVTKYANCRAVSPRRLEVRAALSLCVGIEAACSLEVATAREDAGLYTRQQEVVVTAPVAMAEKILAVTETVDFPADLPPAEQMLGGDCRAVIRECKLLAGKAIVKGQVCFHQIYTDEVVEGDVYPLDFELPFSQILDLDGAIEGLPYVAHVTVLSDTQRCVDGPQGDGRSLEVSAKLLVQLQLYGQQSLPLLLDAYHTACPVDLETHDLSVSARLGSRCEVVTLPMSMELPAGVLEEIVDVWVQPLFLGGEVKAGKAILTGRTLVSMVVRDADGMLSYFERPEEYRLEYPCSGNEVTAHAAATDWRYRTADGKLELQLTLAVTLEPAQRMIQRVVNRVALHTDRPYPPEKATLKLYYADAGESLWDIGRHCHTSPVVIADENGLTGDTLEQATVLMVPVIS